MPGRSWSDASREYRYGFNGKEKDNETSKDNYDFGARIYDGRLGRWLSLDPLKFEYQSFSCYTYCINNPIILIDFNGEEIRNAYDEYIDMTIDKIITTKGEIWMLQAMYGGKADTKKEFRDNQKGNQDWKNDWKMYKRKKRELKNLNFQLFEFAKKKVIIDKIISNMKLKLPNMYKIMNEAPRDIYIDFEMDNMESNYGEMQTTVVVFDGSFKYMEGPFYISLNEDLFNDNGDAHSEQGEKTLKHEMGHAFEEIYNEKDYFEYIIKFYGGNKGAYDAADNGFEEMEGGHNPGNPSGERAKEWEDLSGDLPANYLNKR